MTATRGPLELSLPGWVWRLRPEGPRREAESVAQPSAVGVTGSTTPVQAVGAMVTYTTGARPATHALWVGVTSPVASRPCS